RDSGARARHAHPDPAQRRREAVFPLHPRLHGGPFARALAPRLRAPLRHPRKSAAHRHAPGAARQHLGAAAVAALLPRVSRCAASAARADGQRRGQSQAGPAGAAAAASLLCAARFVRMTAKEVWAAWIEKIALTILVFGFFIGGYFLLGSQ